MMPSCVVVLLMWCSSFASLVGALQLESRNSSVKSTIGYDESAISAFGDVAKSAQGTIGNGWQELFNRIDSHSNDHDRKFMCTSASYKEFLNTLPPWQNLVNDLTLPANKSILFYGSSYVDNLWTNIAVANQNNLNKQTNAPKCVDGDSADDSHADSHGDNAVTYSYTNGAEVVVLKNVECFQTSKNIGKLKTFMENTHFDSVFFMDPHRECWFDKWNKTTGEKCCEDGHRKARTFFENAKIFWDVISHRRQGPLFQVERWENRKQLVNNGSFQHATGSNYIATSSIMAHNACKTEDDCQDHEEIYGHQCIPSYLTIIAKEVVQKMKR